MKIRKKRRKKEREKICLDVQLNKARLFKVNKSNVKKYGK